MTGKDAYVALRGEIPPPVSLGGFAKSLTMEAPKIGAPSFSGFGGSSKAETKEETQAVPEKQAKTMAVGGFGF
jgi:hypothetical protein